MTVATDDLTTAWWCLASLHGALERLAEPAQGQVAWLEATGLHHDELGLDLGDAIGITWAPTRAGLLSPEQMGAITAVDAAIAAISGPAYAALWTDNGLHHAHEWAEIRVLARTALRRLWDGGIRKSR